MLKINTPAAKPGLVVICSLMVAGCSPALDWREVRGSDAPYTALFPAKPAVHTRSIVLDGKPVDMTMQGAEVKDVTYAIGSVTLADQQQASRTAGVLQAAMVRNISGTMQQEKPVFVSGTSMTQIMAVGKDRRGQAVQLHARFAARGSRAYQAIVLGPADKVSPEAAETFLESFKPGQQ